MRQQPREFESHSTNHSILENSNQKGINIIKVISQTKLQKLLEIGILRNTKNGYISATGQLVGSYRTKNGKGKVYIEDKYADWQV